MSQGDIRGVLRTALLQNGVPADAVDEVVDLAVHACDSAVDTFAAVLARASDARVAKCAMGVGLSVLHDRIAHMVSGMIALEGENLRTVQVELGA